MKIENFKPGMIVTILSCPNVWASQLNENNPLQINYPYTCKIEKIKMNLTYTAMTDGKYGWDLSDLVDNNLIIPQKLERKLKLKKLNKIENENRR